jgi:arginyl-tRNA synthetase
VDTQYYINDCGRQVDLLGNSLKRRYLELIKKKKDLKALTYKGKYLKIIASKLYETYGNKWKNKAERYFADYAVTSILDDIKITLKNFGIEYKSWISEKKEISQKEKINALINRLKEIGLIYKKNKAVWVALSKFTNTKDKVLIRKDNSPTYLLHDVIYHIFKLESNYSKLINIWGQDHHGYIPSLVAILKALKYPIEEKLDFILCQFVSLLEEGKREKMSTRHGKFITLEQLCQEIGTDTAKFYFLSYSPDKHIEFSLKEAKEKKEESGVYYLQYAHARICSLINKSKEDFSRKPKLNLLTLKEEHRILLELALFPDIIEEAGEKYSPFLILQAAEKLATLFHYYYSSIPILKEEEDLRYARLVLAYSVKTVIKICLNILGISAPEKM